MKQLKIPLCPEFAELKLEQIADLLDEKGVCGSIDSVNWKEKFPYKPITFFYLARTSERLYIKFAVKGNLLRAVHDTDQQPVSQDSCVEFFCKLPNSSQYFNFEFNCIGTCYAAKRVKRTDKELLSPSEMAQIERYPSIGTKPFEEIEGLFQWDLTVSIPFSLIGIDADHLPDKLMANFYKCADATSLKHYVSWNPIESEHPNFHQPNFFGTLLF
ncbi:MAG TPA: carbohydrate-binding family 9-like protein [Paludibacteraceae bacterium]|nr:carbohydrate-binding family 9-like protein [Paludibacteraceae bacterium]HOS37526.1 carbohydrate-binding family 9-like protein [Paludibacteraceae bacterium]HPK20265.1 carbohydrate-binding family 9-like protein [Paludibacteraceae bacterium]